MMRPSFRFLARPCLLTVTALTAACGGGDSSNNSVSTGNGSTADTGTALSTQAGRAKLPVIKLAFSTPTDLQVLTVGSTVDVVVQVKVDGASPADGTAVSFTAVAGTLLLAVATTQAGGVMASFNATRPGAQDIAASLQIVSQTASAVRSVYVRPAPAPMEVLVPAYFAPDSTTDWDTLAAGAAAHPTLAVTAIMNPNNGIFTVAEADYLRVLTQFAGVGGKTVGYVYTGYGTGSRSLASIKANIDNYLALYGRGLIGGFFLDEMSSDPDQIAFYQEIYGYIKQQDASLRVIGNPGTVPDAVYATVADTLVTFENRAANYQQYDPRQGHDWLYLQGNQRQAALAHNASNCTAMQKVLATAATARFNAGPVYVTNLKYNPDTGVGDPWKALPRYWMQLLGSVAALNTGAAMPAC